MDERFESIGLVLTKLGLQEVKLNNSNFHYDWDFVWGYFGCSSMNMSFSKLKHHQKINHFPGIAALTFKSRLASETDSVYVPKGFTNLQSLKEYAKTHPNTRYVEKLKSNRGVSLKKVEDINFSRTGDLKNEYFAQVFLDNPYLVDGHKFDLNVYVAITSVNPLRVYYYSKNYHLRFCRKPYNPNDFTDHYTYVVGDGHIPGLAFPAMEKYVNRSYLLKDALHTYFIEHDVDPNVIVAQIEDAISTIIMEKEPEIIKTIAAKNPTNGKHHFCEFLRFDFVLDDNIKLKLMEINMSPNLRAYPAIRPVKHVFENVLYNFFNLVGVGSYLKNKGIRDYDQLEEEFPCHDNSLSVMPEVCMKSPCHDECDPEKCKLCWHCMSKEFQYDMKMAYMEHMNMGDYKRVVPPPNDFLVKADGRYWNKLSDTNKLYTKWVMEMCKRNRHFC
ncbi:CLUMA_CG001783, isoform A, partial [Clunio marinus]